MRSSSSLLDELDQQMTSYMSEWNIPEAAVSAVMDGESIIQKGYGLLDMEKYLSATESSLF